MQFNIRTKTTFYLHFIEFENKPQFAIERCHSYLKNQVTNNSKHRISKRYDDLTKEFSRNYVENQETKQREERETRWEIDRDCLENWMRLSNFRTFDLLIWAIS